MKINSADDLFTNELRDIYSAEKQLSRALPRLTKAVQAESLRGKLQERVEEGQTILEAIDQVFEELEVSKGRKKCEAMEGLIEEANQLVEEIENETVLDAALIGAVQKVEHYCIAAWGTAAALGRALDQDTAVGAFEKALENGKRFDDEMTALAENEVNPAMLASAEEDASSNGGRATRKTGARKSTATKDKGKR
ncbi:DUF892 family protein [Rhodospirillaceae bacterium SYSU D60014]|uniref:YciE/YciF ferroxidase family protein n=1 Tax=Virgifigura deserti TaxID=2268457 RepID=UPI000E663A61